MKRILYTLIGIMLSTGAWAENVAKIGTTEYASLAEAVTAATDGQTITVTADCSISSEILIAKSVNIDLNGKTVTTNSCSAFQVKGGKLNLTGSEGSKIVGTPANYKLIYLYGSADATASEYSVVNVGENVTVDCTNGYAVMLSANGNSGYGVKVNIDGTATGEYGGLYVNGNITKSEGNVPVFTVGENAQIISTNGTAIYAAGYAEWSIAGNVTGKNTGIEIRAGKLDVTKGTIIGNGEVTNANPNGNGTTAVGAGIAVAQHTTKLPINVKVSGGEIKGYTAFYQIDAQSNGEDALSKISFDITGGKFTTINGGTNAIYSENKSGFVSGGTFNAPVPEGYCASGFIPTKNDDGTYGVKEGTYVAQIGSTKYATLAEAVAAVPTDGTETTITMLDDVDLGTTYINLPATKNVVLELNGKTITSAYSSYGTFRVYGKFTINGEGTIQSTKKYAIQLSAATADVVLNDATLKSSTTSTVYATAGKFTMNSGSIESEDVCLNCKNIDIQGGTIYAKGNYAITGIGSISGGTITSAGNYGIYANTSGDLIITGGNITGTKAAVSIYTGNVKVEDSATLSSKIIFASNASGIVLAGTAERYIPESSDLEIYDGETLVGYFTSSSTATSCSEMDGKTVKLSKDINAMINIIGYDMVLDLNNHNITSTDGAAIMVKAGSSATKVRNVTITGEGNVSCDNGGGCVAVYVDRYNKLTIEGGNYVVGGDADNATIYIYRSYHTAPTLVNITGGTYHSGDGKWILNINDDAVKEAANIIVTGGKYYNFDPANSTVDGGSESYGTNYVADGYITEMTESGSDKIYTVKEGQWIALIEGGVDSKFRFATLDNAITAANGADKDVTITLLADATATIEPATNVKIDANSKVLTLPTFTVSDGTALTYAKVTNATDDTYKVTTATYNRTGAAGTQWGTVCLPFSFESAPDGYTLYTPTAVNATTLTVETVTYPVAIGTPVIFYKNTTDEAVITSANASVKINATPVAQSGTLALVGTFTDETITENLPDIYFINGDKFHQAQVSLTVPAYRAYINYTTGTAAKPSILSIFVGGEATGVEKVSMENESVEGIYDVNGMKLSAPKKGMNIMKLANGKTVKLIVK